MIVDAGLQSNVKRFLADRRLSICQTKGTEKELKPRFRVLYIQDIIITPVVYHGDRCEGDDRRDLLMREGYTCLDIWAFCAIWQRRNSLGPAWKQVIANHNAIIHFDETILVSEHTGDLFIMGMYYCGHTFKDILVPLNFDFNMADVSAVVRESTMTHRA